MTIRDTLFLRAFGLLKVPMIFFSGPTVLELSGKRTVVKIPLSYRTKNHLGSMYFGALCVGADCAGGILAMKLAQPFGKRASISFKDFSAHFLKRPTADTLFICDEGDAIRALVKKAAESAARENATIDVRAEAKNEIVARFKLTLSIRIKPR